MEERPVQIFIQYERAFSLVFWDEEWLVGCDPFYVKLWVNWPLLERSCQFWTDIYFTRISSAVTPSVQCWSGMWAADLTHFPLRSSSATSRSAPAPLHFLLCSYALFSGHDKYVTKLTDTCHRFDVTELTSSPIRFVTALTGTRSGHLTQINSTSTENV